MTPEFSRPERVDTIGEQERGIAIAADADERAALARRFDLVSVELLEAEFRVRRAGECVAAKGVVRAQVTQACSVTDEPIAARIDEPVELRFAAAEDTTGSDEVELSDAALDTLPIERGAIDLGEAAAETLALALDPYPRGPGAAAALKRAGVLSEEEAKPAGALAALKDLLGGSN